jgi:hypothetical protein
MGAKCVFLVTIFIREFFVRDFFLLRDFWILSI